MKFILNLRELLTPPTDVNHPYIPFDYNIEYFEYHIDSIPSETETSKHIILKEGNIILSRLNEMIDFTFQEFPDVKKTIHLFFHAEVNPAEFQPNDLSSFLKRLAEKSIRPFSFTYKQRTEDCTQLLLSYFDKIVEEGAGKIIINFDEGGFSSCPPLRPEDFSDLLPLANSPSLSVELKENASLTPANVSSLSIFRAPPLLPGLEVSSSVSNKSQKQGKRDRSAVHVPEGQEELIDTLVKTYQSNTIKTGKFRSLTRDPALKEQIKYLRAERKRYLDRFCARKCRKKKRLEQKMLEEKWDSLNRFQQTLEDQCKALTKIRDTLLSISCDKTDISLEESSNDRACRS